MLWSGMDSVGVSLPSAAFNILLIICHHKKKKKTDFTDLMIVMKTNTYCIHQVLHSNLVVNIII